MYVWVDAHMAVTLYLLHSVSCKASDFVMQNTCRAPCAAVCLCVQALSVYYGWARLIMNMPISWMPNLTDVAHQVFKPHAKNATAVAATAAAVATPAAAAQPSGVAKAWQFMQWVITLVTGGPVTLDCLFQSWGLWQGSTGSDAEDKRPPPQAVLATAVIMRTFIRWVQTPGTVRTLSVSGVL